MYYPHPMYRMTDKRQTCLGESIQVGGLAWLVGGMQLEQVDDVLRRLDVAETLEVTQRQLSGDLDTVELKKVQLGLMDDVIQHAVRQERRRLSLMLDVVPTHTQYRQHFNSLIDLIEYGLTSH